MDGKRRSADRHIAPAVIAEQNDDVEIDDKDLASINEIIQLRKPGVFMGKGRTSYYTLKHPVKVHGTSFHSVKIKGAGYYRDSQRIEKPSSDAFVREEPHFGFDDLGRGIIEFSKPAPFGGITISRAKREYENFLDLDFRKVSTLTALALYQYRDLSFEGENLGVVVSLCHDPQPFRLMQVLWENRLLGKDQLSYYANIMHCEGIQGDYDDLDNKLNLITIISEKYSREVRKLSDAGFYIHSGIWSNIQYSIEKRKVVLVDLDSTRRITEIAPDLRLLYSTRELISNIHRFFTSLYHPNSISQFNAKIIESMNFPRYFIAGYLPESPQKHIDSTAQKITEYYLDKCFVRIKAIEPFMNSMTREQERRMELEVTGFFDYCLTILYPLIINACLKHRSPDTLNKYPGLSPMQQATNSAICTQGHTQVEPEH